MFEIRNNQFGKSIYATEPILKGTSICRFTGKPLAYEQTRKLGGSESFALQISNAYYLFLDEPWRFFNHSCGPNTGLNPDLELVALDDVMKDEELTYDYSTTMLERHWTMSCKCRSDKCRHVIMDFDKLPQEIQTYYVSHKVVQAFILDHLGIQ